MDELGNRTGQPATGGLRGAILAVVVAWTALPAAGQQGDTRIESKFAAERQFAALLESNTTLEGEIRQLTALRSKADAARKCIDAAKADEAVAQKQTDDLRTRFQALRNENGATVIHERNRDLGTLDDFKEALFREDMIRSIWDCQREFTQRSSTVGTVKSIEEVVLDSAWQPGADRREGREAFAAVDEMIARARGDRVRRSDLPPELLARVNAELSRLTPAVWVAQFETYRRQASEFAAAVTKRAEAEIATRQATMRENDAKLAALDKTLAQKQTTASALNQGLVYSIYGMILALVVLFISLRFFPVEIASRMIQDRSVVEVMSMAFILLTIIILGTGEKIGQETLGTLLGTIAGYIFGRKMGENARANGAPDEVAGPGKTGQGRQGGQARRGVTG